MTSYLPTVLKSGEYQNWSNCVSEDSLITVSATKAVLKNAWQIQHEDDHQRGTGTRHPVADDGKMELEIDFRIQSVSHGAVEQEEDSRTRLIQRLVHQVKNHPNKNAWIADLHRNRPKNPLSEESKQMIHTLGNVECFDYLAEGNVYCTCGTWLVPTEFTRKLNRERFDTVTIPSFVINKGGRHGARHGKSEAQREYRQAMDCLMKAKRITSIQSFSVSNNGRLTEIHRWKKAGMRNFASVLTELHATIIHTSPLGTKGEGTRRIGN